MFTGQEGVLFSNVGKPVDRDGGYIKSDTALRNVKFI